MAKQSLKERLAEGRAVLAEKSKELGGFIADKSEEIGEAANDAVKAASDTFKQSIEASRNSKYNPVFIEDIEAEDFIYPDLIQIVDGDKIRQKYYPNSIGWLDKEEDMSILHLYNSMVASAPINASFAPKFQSALFYCDHIKPDYYVNLGEYFVAAQKARQIELQQIAYDLGAKNYSVQIIEEESDLEAIDRKVKAKAQKGTGKSKESGGGEFSEGSSTNEKKRTKIETGVRFESGSDPKEPKLAWFKDDPQIRHLIDMRLAKERQMTEYELIFEYSSLSAMSRDTAAKLDGVAGALKANIGYSIKEKLLRENKKKLVFYIEF